jgi:SAM-dependent methyltransferase
MAGQSVHPVARDAWGGGRPATLAAYVAARPSYPAAALNHAVDALGLAPGAALLEVAAGTGKLTQQLLAHPRGFRVTATEPNEGMCAEFERSCPSTAVVRAEAAALPFPDASFDAVFVAQAFHCERGAPRRNVRPAAARRGHGECSSGRHRRLRAPTPPGTLLTPHACASPQRVCQPRRVRRDGARAAAGRRPRVALEHRGDRGALGARAPRRHRGGLRAARGRAKLL